MIPHHVTRRAFLRAAGLAGTAALLRPSSLLGQEAPPYPYVDGLCAMPPDPADIARSGLTSFILDVSSVAPVQTEDGTVRYYRSFDASAQSLVARRRSLLDGQVPGAFLATRGSQIREAFDAGGTAIFFQFQGAQPLEGDIWRLDLFHELGLRILQLTHHNANPFAGGALDAEPSGLSSLGHDLVARMNELRVLPDISHGSDATALDVTRASTSPVILSHGAARALVPNARCAPDEVIRALAETGGVMGVFMMSFWLTTDPVPTTDHLIAQLRHVANVGGIESVAIANDYPVTGEAHLRSLDNDNAEGVKAYHPWWQSIAQEGILGFDENDLPRHVVIPELNNVRRMYTIDDALARAGFSWADRERIMGGNWIRVLQDVLD